MADGGGADFAHRCVCDPLQPLAPAAICTTSFCPCSYPAFAPTPLSNDLTTLYWGGPALGLNKTAAAIPNGAAVLAYFAHEDLPRDTIPAVVL